MRAHLRALGLNKQLNNMARLKVKQISDFTSAVNGLIGTSQVAVDDSIDSLESQLSEGLDSLGVIDSAVSNALAAEISTTDAEVGSLEVIQSAISNALGDEGTARGTEVASLEVIDSAISNAVAGILAGADVNMDNFSEVVSYINSVDAASDLDLVNELASVDTRFGSVDARFTSGDTRFGNLEGDVSSLEVIDSAISNALAAEISTTDAEVGSLEVIDSAVSNALAAEISTTDAEVGSLEVIDSAISNALATEISTTDAEVSSLEVIDSAISNALAAEISTTDGEISDLQDSVDSLESQLNGFAKEAYIHGAFSGIVTGGGMTVQVMDTAGVQLEGGANASEAGGNTVNIDLVTAIEGATALEHEANFVFLTVNGQFVNHDAIRINAPTQVSLVTSQLGFDLEADDVLEFKYIKD